MALLYADEDFDQAAVEELRGLGHDVATARDAGRAGQSISDAEQLAFATAQGRAILTHNRWDFVRLHRQGPGHSGIIACTPDRDAVALARRIDSVVLSESPLDTKLIRINLPARS